MFGTKKNATDIGKMIKDTFPLPQKLGSGIVGIKYNYNKGLFKQDLCDGGTVYLQTMWILDLEYLMKRLSRRIAGKWVTRSLWPLPTP